MNWHCFVVPLEVLPLNLFLNSSKKKDAYRWSWTLLALICSHSIFLHDFSVLEFCSFLLSLSSNLSLSYYKHLIFFLIYCHNLYAFLIFLKPKILIFLDWKQSLEYDYWILSILSIFSYLVVLICSIISWRKTQYLLRYWFPLTANY